MFNRQPFNRGKFNVASSQSSGSNGIGIMVMGTNSTLVQKVISAKGITTMIMSGTINATKVKFNNGITDMVMSSIGNGTKVFRVVTSTADMVMLTDANQSLAGESIIVLEDINLKPGDELIINTCDMTITINGQNAMQYFNNESEFFSLLSGLNTLIYSDTNASRQISFDVIWKDRWL